MEYDLVDFDDNFIKTGTKEDAKKLGLFTRSVHIWLLNEKGELMLCKRSPTKKSYPNLLTSSAGGHVDKGENHEIAAKRELKEELGVSVPLKDVGRFDVVTSNERTIHHLFIGKSTSGLIIDSSEISSYSFVPFDFLSNDVSVNPSKYSAPFLSAFKLYLSIGDKKDLQ